jgi:hypothetical protein
MKKRGQVTIFVIIAIVIVVAGVLVYMFFPEVKDVLTSNDDNPKTYISECLSDDFISIIEKVSLQGASIDPTNYYLFEDSKVNYLCYTSEYYIPCVVQVPFVKTQVVDLLKEEMREKVDSCFKSLKTDYEEKGYQVKIESAGFDVEIMPKRTSLVIDKSVTLTKEESKRYDSFTINLNNNLYQVLSVVNSIVEHETVRGEIETTEFMQLYRDLKIEKLKQSDGTKIYKITNKPDNSVFQFASRGMAFPPGYI